MQLFDGLKCALRASGYHPKRSYFSFMGRYCIIDYAPQGFTKGCDGILSFYLPLPSIQTPPNTINYERRQTTHENKLLLSTNVDIQQGIHTCKRMNVKTDFRKICRGQRIPPILFSCFLVWENNFLGHLEAICSMKYICF